MLDSEGPISRVSVTYDRRHMLWMSIINEYDGRPINMNMMDVHHYEYDECPSFMNDMNVHHVLRTHALNSGRQSYMYDECPCPSYLMYFSYKCLLYM